MTRVLFIKLLRDLRWNLLGIMLLLAAFQFLWARVTERLLGTITPFFVGMAGMAGLRRLDLEQFLFQDGFGSVLRTIIGGEKVVLDRAMDLLSIGYVHPVMQFVFCIWAVGRASGAIAGEIDRGTMELLLAQPLARARLVLAHLLVDCVTVPCLCLALFAGNLLGAWWIDPIKVREPDKSMRLPFKVPTNDDPEVRKQLEIHPWRFARAMPVVGGLVFGISGLTMWVSALGRYRWRVTGVAVGMVLMMFLINVLGQMWDPAAWLRPLTLFYYYQPQQVIPDGGGWSVAVGGAAVPMLAVLYGAGAAGYLLALVTLVRRDIPAPL
ncbi:MAG: ABC transporter permease subunit [Gemmataceae bacterium]